MPIQRPQRGRPLRSGRTELAPYASSLVVSDIAEAELVGGSGRPGPWPQPTVKRVGGAATAQTQGYGRPDESEMDAGCAWWTFVTTMLDGRVVRRLDRRVVGHDLHSALGHRHESSDPDHLREHLPTTELSPARLGVRAAPSGAVSLSWHAVPSEPMVDTNQGGFLNRVRKFDSCRGHSSSGRLDG